MSGLSFSEYVRELDSRIILTHLCENKSGGVLGERVYLDICAEYITAESVEKRYLSLDESRRSILMQIYLSGSSGWIVPGEDSAQDLLVSFLVYEGQILGKRALFGFTDLVQFLNPLFCAQLPQNTVPSPQHAAFTALPSDSAVLLSLIRHGDVKRRQDSILLKTSVDQFWASALIQTSVDTPSPETINRLLELLIHFMLSKSIIRFTEEGYELRSDGEETWRELLPSLTAEFLGFAAGCRKTSGVLLTAELLDAGAVFSGEYARTNDLELQLMTAAWCGKAVYRQGYWSRGLAYDVPSIETGHIMPDFTILFPRELSPWSLYQILQCAVIESADLLCRARISRELVSDSCARGVNGESLLALFRSWNCSPHMIRTFEEWIYSFDRLFVDGNYLAISSRAGDFIAQHPEIESLLTPFQEYRFYRIAPHAAGEIRNRLEKMGFDSRMPFPSEPKSPAQHPKMIEKITPAVPLFTPELLRKEPVQTNFGKYGGALRSQTLVELLKIVRFAILMEEKIAVVLNGESDPIIFTPVDVRTGENGAVVGRDSSNGTVEFRLDVIDKIGVVHDS